MTTEEPCKCFKCEKSVKGKTYVIQTLMLLTKEGYQKHDWGVICSDCYFVDEEE